MHSQVTDKLESMQLRSSGKHLKDINILRKSIRTQVKWLRTVAAEEQKEEIWQRKEEHAQLMEWRTTQLRRLQRQGINNRFQQGLNRFAVTLPVIRESDAISEDVTNLEVYNLHN